MVNDLIQLAVIYYGDPAQFAANQEQFTDLKELLPSFTLTAYTFNTDKTAQERLLTNYKAGKIDLVLKNAYGRGHEADLEQFLESHQIPFLGSDKASTLTGTAKDLAKAQFRAQHLPVVEDLVIHRQDWQDQRALILSRLATELDMPIIIKDAAGTDSRGISVVDHQSKIEPTIDAAFQLSQTLVVEHYLEQVTEVTCLVIDGADGPIAYEPVELRIGGLFSAEMKDTGQLMPMIPANLPHGTIEEIKSLAQAAHQALGCRSFSRADILVKHNKLYLLEVDVHPGFRKKSPTVLSINYAGQTLDQVFLELYHQVNQIKPNKNN